MTHKTHKGWVPIPEKFSILLNLPAEDVRAMDEICELLGWTRTQFMRQSIARNLNYFNQHERDHFELGSVHKDKIGPVQNDYGRKIKEVEGTTRININDPTRK